MPTPAIVLRLRKIRRRFGIAAPKVAVTTHVSWHWYVVGSMLLTSGIGVAAYFIARDEKSPQLERELGELRGELSKREQELSLLKANASIEQSTVQMERTTQQQLLARVKVLERENGELKEERSLYERLVKECPRRLVTDRKG